MWPPADLPKVLDRGEQLRLLYRSSLSHFPPHDQQHAIQFDLLINLLNLLAATSTCPTPTVTQRAAVAIDDMNDDELFFHVLQQELTSVNRHFEESAGAILAKWAAYTRDTSSRSASSRNSQDLCCPRMDSLTESCDSSHSGASSEDPCLHQQKTRQAWTIAQAAKWCWQFACINALAARCLVEKYDDIRRDGAGALFLETHVRHCRFMQSPLLLELQAIAALQHVASDSGLAPPPAPLSFTRRSDKGSPPSSPSGASTTSSLSHAARAAAAGSAADEDGPPLRGGALPAAVLEPFLCQPTCKTIPTQCKRCHSVLHAAIGLACGCVLCDVCAVQQLIDDAQCLRPTPSLRRLQRLKSLAIGQRKKVSHWLSMPAETQPSLDDDVRKHVQQAMALQACPCCGTPGSFREAVPLPALATVAARTHPDQSDWAPPPADQPAWLHDAVYEVAFAGLPIGGCGDTQRGGRGPGAPLAMRKAVEQPGFVRPRALRRWRGEAPAGWAGQEVVQG